MADEENLGGEKAAWTIKSVPVETRKLAIASAAKAGLSMGEWVVAAVRNQANLESGERILPPSSSHSRNIPAPAASGPPVDMLALAELMRATQSFAQGAGVPIPKATARHAVAWTTTALRAARGLPALAPRLGKLLDKPEQTFIEIGQTDRKAERD